MKIFGAVDDSQVVKPAEQMHMDVVSSAKAS